MTNSNCLTMESLRIQIQKFEFNFSTLDYHNYKNRVSTPLPFGYPEGNPRCVYIVYNTLPSTITPLVVCFQRFFFSLHFIIKKKSTWADFTTAKYCPRDVLIPRRVKATPWLTCDASFHFRVFFFHLLYIFLVVGSSRSLNWLKKFMKRDFVLWPKQSRAQL